MSKKGIIATVFFMALTVSAIVTEVVFAFDGDKDTHPWTDLIVRYVPWELGLAAFGAIFLWAPIHFYVRYKRKHKPQSLIKPSDIDAMTDEETRALIKQWRQHGKPNA